MATRRIRLADLVPQAREQLILTLDVLAGKLVVLGMVEWGHVEPRQPVADQVMKCLLTGNSSDVRWAWSALDVAGRGPWPAGTDSETPDTQWWATPLGRVLASTWAREERPVPVTIDEAGAILGLTRARVYQLIGEGVLCRSEDDLLGSSIARRLIDVGVAVHRRGTEDPD